jgi:putative flavoprotein involved in K+ transport
MISKNNNQSDVVIIGAGPAGLCLAYHLKKYGLNPKILEKNNVVGSTWANMPDHLRLISPWQASSLLKEQKFKYSRSYRMKAKEYAQYLQKFAEDNNFDIDFNVDVKNIGKILEIRTNNKTYIAKNVIWCGGYFNNPYIPEEFSSLKTPAFHFKDFKNARQLADVAVRDILVVGKRLSAGQLIIELNREGINCDLFIRNPIEFTFSPFIFNQFFKYMDEIENLLAPINGNKKFKVDVKMESGKERELIKHGEVKLVRKIEKKYDMIIFATGFNENLLFKENLQNLKKDFESNITPNLFYLGYDQQVNYRSRFLRGIRQDAKKLAKIIKDRSKNE